MPILPAQAEGLGLWAKWEFDPERVVQILAVAKRERPFQGRYLGIERFPRPAAWAGRTGLSGRKTWAKNPSRRCPPGRQLIARGVNPWIPNECPYSGVLR